MTENSKPRFSDLSDHLLLRAKEELGETDEVREKALEEMKLWLEVQEKKYKNFDELSLLWFLRGCKFNVERTKARIENFYSFRAKVTEWYADRDPLLPEVMEILELGTFLPLPGRDDNGRKVVLIRATVHNPYVHKQDTVLKVMNMVVELMCRDDESISVTGVVAIVDLKGVGMGHAMQMTPSVIRKAVNSWQDVNPIRTKSMHYINTPFNVHVVLNIFRSFMKEKLRKRLHLHRGDSKQALAALIPSENLPEDFGGSGPSVASLTAKWKDRVIAQRDWFTKPEEHGPFS